MIKEMHVLRIIARHHNSRDHKSIYKDIPQLGLYSITEFQAGCIIASIHRSNKFA